MLLSLLLALSLAPTPQDASRVAPPHVARQDLAAWRAHLLPTEEELAYERIPWIPSFAEGLARASQEGRPLLFWAMNGHPLGCT